MSKKILAILGSPRKNGNIAKALDITVESAKMAGHNVDFIDLYKCNIAYCKGCMGCRKSSVCIMHDDIDIIKDKLISCDIVILAAPTYFANIHAPVKSMFDRLAGTIMDDNNGMIPKPKLSKSQKYFLITACSTPTPFDRLAKQSVGCLSAMKEFFRTSGMKSLGHVILAGTKGKNELPPAKIKKLQKIIERAY